MAKKKGKKNDTEKIAALQAKKEAKADKAARKRLQKDSSKSVTSTSSSSDPTATASVSNARAAATLDDLLQVYRQKDIVGSQTVIKILPGFPPARGNATLTLCEGDQKGKQDLFLFGGEYYDGVENVVLDHLLRWDIKNEQWKHILTPSTHPAPPSRCAHSTVYYNGAMYVFGGELASTDHYHHYKDLWRFDLGKQTWIELTSRTGSVPSARSGHSAIVWKYFLIIFGGFYEAARDTPRWFNDVYVFNLQTQQWMDVPHSKLTTRPEPRSACNVALVGDTAVIHGGYSKLSAATATQGRESKVHTDAWMLHLKPLLQGKPPTWERLMSSGGRGGNKNPNGRSGTASATYKNRMLVFGGVVDSELMHHKVDSVFYNDLYAFDMDQRKWFPLRVRKSKNTDGSRRRSSLTSDDEGEADEPAKVSSEMKEERENESEDQKKNDDEDDLLEEDDGEDSGVEAAWDLEKLRSNMFAFIDGSGNVVYEKIEDDEEEQNEHEEMKDEEEKVEMEVEESKEEMKEHIPTSESVNPESNTTEKRFSGVSGNIAAKDAETKADAQISPHVKIITRSSVMTVNPDTNAPEVVERSEPLPRINAALVVRGHTLFVYGGLLEIGDREVTLDDFWKIDLRKRDKWECLWPGTIHKQVWRGAIHDDDDSYISSTAGDDGGEVSDSSEDEENAEEPASGKQNAGGTVNARREFAELNEKYGLDDVDWTPQRGEVLADFYARTSDYWNAQAVEKIKASGSNAEPTNKELKREGFSLARQRFEDLADVMERLNHLGISKDRKNDNPKKGQKS